jgi:hypothetical protein
MRLRWVVPALALILAGCASISQPLPPALHVPQRVTGLSAVEQGSSIVLRFTLPTETMENLAIRKPVSVEVRIGVAVVPFQLEAWESSAKPYTDIPTGTEVVNYALPAAEWMGKDVLIGVEVFGANGRTAGWSSLIPLSLAPPLATPEGLARAAVAEGVRLTWRGSAAHYRIYRRVEDAKEAAVLGETDRLVYTDTTTEYGKTYHYSVEGFLTRGDIHLVSDRTPEVNVMPRDTWPPPVPTALAAVVSGGTISLVWDRSIAPDLAGYRIYRAEGDGPFTSLAETREGPSYSDHTVSPGKAYRYVVSAFDQLNNESEKSAPVSVTAR